MNFFGFGKKHAAAEIVGYNITALIMDADDCWRDVCELRSYKPSGPVATCELALARAAIAFDQMRTHRQEAVVERMINSALRCVAETFVDQDNDDTLAFYGGPLSKVGPSVIGQYEDNIFPLTQWASRVGARLGVPGVSASEITPIAERQQRRVKDALNKVRVV